MVTKHYYNFLYSTNMFEIRSRGFNEHNIVMSIKFSKQIANRFAKIINDYKGEFKTLSNSFLNQFKYQR